MLKLLLSLFVTLSLSANNAFVDLLDKSNIDETTLYTIPTNFLRSTLSIMARCHGKKSRAKYYPWSLYPYVS